MYRWEVYVLFLYSRSKWQLPWVMQLSAVVPSVIRVTCVKSYQVLSLKGQCQKRAIFWGRPHIQAINTYSTNVERNEILLGETGTKWNPSDFVFLHRLFVDQLSIAWKGGVPRKFARVSTVLLKRCCCCCFLFSFFLSSPFVCFDFFFSERWQSILFLNFLPPPPIPPSPMQYQNEAPGRKAAQKGLYSWTKRFIYDNTCS